MSPANEHNYERVKLLAGSPFFSRARTDKQYLLELKEEYLLQNFYQEAGLLGAEQADIPHMFGLWTDRAYHRGWEDPTCQLRGHFLGHWLSAACYLYAMTGDARLKGKADFIVAELAKCQERNGGGWAAPIPEKYLRWVAQGKPVWAPHYNIHKLFMGLNDAARLLGSRQALDIAVRFADWFTGWSEGFDEERMQDILDVETGGMMEAFADLYGLTNDPRHLALMRRYEHKRLFNRLLAGEDILSNRHANTTIPEVHGVCRAYELTGERRYRDIMHAYWECAVEKRGAYLTGGQTLGEIWTPADGMGARIGHKTQEHCTVYNMIRLADYLYRDTGEVRYQDYIEENLYNGVLAQCFWEGYGDDYGHHSSFSNGFHSTVVTYFLPMAPGSKKIWSTPTESFFCCHGSAVQACASFQNYVFYENDGGVAVNQYIPAAYQSGDIRIELTRDPLVELPHRPDFWRFHLHAWGGRYRIALRIPCWSAATGVSVDGAACEAKPEDGYLVLDQEWTGQRITVDCRLELRAVPLPGGDRYALREGPVALAPIADGEVAIRGSAHAPLTWLAVHEEREWERWNNLWITKGQNPNRVFKYLYEIYDEAYTPYFTLEQ